MLEITRFRLRPDADLDAFLGADARLQTEFAYQQPGLARRTTARGSDEGWIVVDIWASAAQADACAEVWGSDSCVAEWLSFVDPESVSNERFWPLD
ncbi:MAG TPA: hypothetical protein VGP46_05570 [Acidimicrobiales bacterium]|nr:hypothetical protein [Acidimicrobiales bacterium]